jgi:hypothetical protein
MTAIEVPEVLDAVDTVLRGRSFPGVGGT